MIWISLGANLPDRHGRPPLQTCLHAVERLRRIAEARVALVSPWYRSSPIPPSGQPTYINGMVGLIGELAPEAMLAALQAIEAEAGRVRGEANAARTLDLDIIDMDGLVRDRPDPILPHPRAHLRAFVLCPLRDLAPDWRHPVLRQTIAELIAALPPQELHPLSRMESSQSPETAPLR